jgi:hypothetical protein
VALEEAREATLGHANAVLGQSRTKLMQIETGLRLVERQDQLGMSLDPVRALISAHGLGGDVTLTSELPAPTARARQADPEAFGCLVSRRASLDGMDHALTQIDGQG